MGEAGALVILLPLLAALLFQVSGHASAAHLHPLVIVPGAGTSRIDARLTDSYHSSGGGGICGAAVPAGWFRLWRNRTLLREPLLRCFGELIQLHYDAAADDYRNTAGVETVAPFFGSVEGFRYRDPDAPTLREVNRLLILREDNEPIAALLQRLEAAGYRDGVDLFGAPYDFRYGLAADGHPSRVGNRLLQDLKGLIERASAAAGGKPAVVLAHSMGNLFVLRLLTRSSPSWRRRFVKHVIAVAAPWGGAVKEMYVAATGDVRGGLEPVRLQMGSFECNSWFLPSAKTFGPRPLVITSRRSYAAADMPEFLAAAGFLEAGKTYGSRVLPLVEKLPPPGVPVTCVSGTGVATPELLIYGDGFSQLPEIVYGDGDGTVNMESLLAAAAEWSGLPEQPLKVVKIANATHDGVLAEEETWRVIMEQVAAVEVPSKHGKTSEDSEQLSNLSF